MSKRVENYQFRHTFPTSRIYGKPCEFLLKYMILYAPKTPEDTPHDRFIQACHWLSYVEYLVDLLIMVDSYERTDVINMMLTDGKLKKLQEHLKKHRKERSYEQEER